MDATMKRVLRATDTQRMLALCAARKDVVVSMPMWKIHPYHWVEE
jgi:hypothetical protein